MISVIIPAYNIGKYISDCLNSIRQQTFKDYEVVAVNDGSKDDTLTVLNDYKKKYPEFPLTIIDKENEGVTAARRDGFIASKGEWICFVDGDDLLPDTALFSLSSNISFGIDAICGAYESFHDGDDVLCLNPIKVPEGRYPCRDVIKFMMINKFNSAPWAKLYRKNKIELAMFDLSRDITNKEDTIFNYRFFSLAFGDIAMTKAIVYQYRKARIGSAFAKMYLSKGINVDYELKVYDIIENIVKSIRDFDKENPQCFSILYYNLMWYCKNSLFNYRGNSFDLIERKINYINLDYIQEDRIIKKYIKYFLLKTIILYSKVCSPIHKGIDFVIKKFR